MTQLSDLKKQLAAAEEEILDLEVKLDDKDTDRYQEIVESRKRLVCALRTRIRKLETAERLWQELRDQLDSLLNIVTAILPSKELMSYYQTDKPHKEIPVFASKEEWEELQRVVYLITQDEQYRPYFDPS